MEHRFRDFRTARRHQHAMKRMYGYSPTIFKVTSRSGVRRFVVVHPRGLKKIR